MKESNNKSGQYVSPDCELLQVRIKSVISASDVSAGVSGKRGGYSYRDEEEW